MSLTKTVNRDLQMLFAVGAGTLALMAFTALAFGMAPARLHWAEFLLLTAVFGLPGLLLSYRDRQRDPAERRIGRMLAAAVIVLALSGLYLVRSRLLDDGILWSVTALALMSFQAWRDRRVKEPTACR